ncbi:MAG: carotenoid 1,2-hydratase [Chloroflexi bacterium]|nr:carotenoid 1,2-hydratase [Chloroflexota bacterium]
MRLGVVAAFLASVALIVSSVLAARSGTGTPAEQSAALPAVAAPHVDAFARAVEPREWSFPADHGAHPEYQTEWWYYTGNLATRDGRRFGYQFTIFRRALAPDEMASDSEWRSNQAFMAHFTVTDVSGEVFYQAQRFSRGAANLAGAEGEPRYRVWLDDWAVEARDDAAVSTTLRARSPEVAIDLALEQVKPPALQGDGGLSPKSNEPGNASYYYSLSRLETSGTISVGETAYPVEGLSWMDHEFSTSALGANAQGWDWFGLHLDDGRDLMLGQIRLQDGGVEPAFGGLLIEPDGSARYLPSSSFEIEATDWWTSPHTNAIYPARWTIRVTPDEGVPFTLALEPLLADQELREGIVYWEGAVRITGDANGYGYAELTGYYDTMRNRF